MTLLWIGLAGFAGAVVRYWLGDYVAGTLASPFPWGTLLINVSGAFALGLLTSVAGARGLIAPSLRIPLAAGFLGAYTTFSTWNLETVQLFAAGRGRLAATNLFLSTGAGLLAALAGLGLGMRL